MTTNQHGGARPGAGRRPSKTDPDIVRLSKTARQELNIIFAAVQSMRSEKFSKAKLIEELIHERWQAYDEQVQADAEEYQNIV